MHQGSTQICGLYRAGDRIHMIHFVKPPFEFVRPGLGYKARSSGSLVSAVSGTVFVSSV